MLEALRAKNWVYRQLLGFFLWLGRFKPRTQILLTVGLYFTVRILVGVTDRYPAAEPFVLAILIPYILFVMLTWFATPFRNVALAFSRDGRMLLTGLAIAHAVVASLLAAATLVVGVNSFFSDDSRIADRAIVLLATTIHYLSVGMIPSGRFRVIGLIASVFAVMFLTYLAWERANLIAIETQLFAEIDDFRELPKSEEPEYRYRNWQLTERFERFKTRKGSFLSVNPYGSYASFGVLLLHMALRSRARKIQFG